MNKECIFIFLFLIVCPFLASYPKLAAVGGFWLLVYGALYLEVVSQIFIEFQYSRCWMLKLQTYVYLKW